MNYKVKEGIVLVHVCGEHLLVASRTVWPDVKMIRHLPKVTAMCWDLLSRGADEKKITMFIATLMKKPLPEVEEKLAQLWEDLYKAGYLEKNEEDVQFIPRRKRTNRNKDGVEEPQS